MSEDKKQKQWLVKDGDGEYVSVLADDWECGGNGLIFLAEGIKVAWFINWQHFRKDVADTQRCNQQENDMRDIILGTVDDLVCSFIYYDRREDEDLPLGAIRDAIASKEISVDEIAAFFKAKLIERLET